MSSAVPILCVVGLSNVGKTTLVVKLVSELKRRGYRVATVKHDVHGFDVDVPGKDSWRHAEAGSDCVFIAGPDKLAMIRKMGAAPSLDDVVRFADGMDIVIAEGFKRSDKPKIEVSRREKGSRLLCSADELVAVATDQPLDLDVPSYGLDDAGGLVDLIENRFLSTRKGGPCLHSTTGTGGDQ
jgi:molybdopterin-guanine dinucleotide biosynthesis adapter protein